MHSDRTTGRPALLRHLVGSLATPPILSRHEDPKRRAHFLGIGDHVNVVSAGCQIMCNPIGADADAALDRRILADDANSHRLTSRSPPAVRLTIRLSAPGIS